MEQDLESPRGRRPRGGRWRRRALGLLLSLGTTYVVLEVALHLFPQLLPRAYRESFPFGGIEFARPGLFDDAPLDELPLPLPSSDWRGTPPRDLVDMGIAGPDHDQDERRYPNLVLRMDDLGLPNLTRPTRADVVFVGDSFMVSAGVLEPPGLTVRFAEETGRTVYNLGVAGCGPPHELFLLHEVGLPMEPSLVVWFFFGGNDVYEVHTLRERQNKGYETWDEVFVDQRPPLLFVPDVVSFLARRRTTKRLEPLAPVPLRTPEGGEHPMWFFSPYLTQLVVPRGQFVQRKVWNVTTDILRRARDTAEGAGARFVMVFLPSKAQVYLPFVERDDEKIFAMATRDGGAELLFTPTAFVDAALAHRASTEQALAGFCAEEGISFFSGTPALEELARRGELGYLTTDTHWQTEGQEAILEPLLEFLRAEGLLAR